MSPSSDTVPPLLPVTIRFLTMPEPPPSLADVPRARPAGIDDPVLASPCPVPFYRFLYNTVGEPWLWDYRRRMGDADLAAILADPAVEVHVVSQDGVPAGYIELDRRHQDDEGVVDIAYFGLMPWAIGQGIGPWLLDWAIRRTWAQTGTRRMTVNTCTFDHPGALATYLRAGFRLDREEHKASPDPRLAGILPRSAAPHIPLAAL